MTSEIYWLLLTTVLTSLLPVAYVVNVVVRQWPGKGLRVLESPPGPGQDRYAWAWGRQGVCRVYECSGKPGGICTVSACGSGQRCG